MTRIWKPNLILLAVLCAGLLLSTDHPPAQAAGGTAVAFVRSTANDGDQIWLVSPNGSDAHPIYSPGVAAPYDQTHIGVLSWKPDATQLAFNSDHEAICSLYKYDLYSIRPDGSGYRRITNAPACGELANYPKGSVTVPYVNFIGENVVIYFQGASMGQFGPPGAGVLTFNNVADLGTVLQSAVAMYGYERWPAATGVDVVAGKTVNLPLPELSIAGAGFETMNAYWPSWRSSGDEISYVFGGHSLREIPANPPPLAWGTDLLASGTSLPTAITDVAWSPDPAKANQLLYRSFDPDPPYNQIRRVTEGSGTAGDVLITPVSDGQDYMGLAWLPDASGFVYSELDPGVWGAIDHGNIYEYSFATGQSTQLTDFAPDNYTGKLSVSPDGQQIVFERTTAKDGTAPIDLWIMNRNGTNMRLFQTDARSPAWSPQSLPTFRHVYLPSLVR